MPSTTLPIPDALPMPLRATAGVLSAAFLALGIAELLAPAGFAGLYGPAPIDPAALPLVSGLGARNVALALIGLVAAWRGLRAPLVLLFGALGLLSVLEFGIVASAAGPMAGIRFVAFALILGAMAVWAARSGRAGGRDARMAG